MNLYEIRMEHFAPKDSQQGIYTYLVANSDEEVYEWLKLEKELKDGRKIYVSYDLYEEDEEEKREIYDENYNVIGEESFKERMIRLKGNLNDEDVDMSDSYYGITLMGWSIIKEDVLDNDIEVLLRAGVAIELTKEEK